MREVDFIPPEDITIPEGRRVVTQAAVASLAKSMGDIGLMTPITVRLIDTDESNGVPVLVTGAHRLAAAKALGWSKIECWVSDVDETQARLWEIDENLMRAELSPAERAEATAERKRIWEDEGGKTFPTGFAADTSAKTGLTKRSINMHVARGEKIAPDVMAEIKATPDLNKGVVLDMVAKAPREEQRQRLSEIAAQRAAKPARRAADPENDYEVTEKQVARLVSAWNAAGKEAREEFMRRIDRPVMSEKWA